MQTTMEAVALIKACEGFEPEAYFCPAGKPTIGYGTTRYHDGATVQIGDSIDHDAAEQELFLHIRNEIEPVLDRLFPGQPIQPGMRDALASFIHNIGADTSKWPTLLRLIREGASRDDVCDQLVKYRRSGKTPLLGLYRRRLAECCLIHGVDWRPALSAKWEDDWRDFVPTKADPALFDDPEVQIPDPGADRKTPRVESPPIQPEAKPMPAIPDNWDAMTPEEKVAWVQSNKPPAPITFTRWYDDLSDSEKTRYANLFRKLGREPTLQEMFGGESKPKAVVVTPKAKVVEAPKVDTSAPPKAMEDSQTFRGLSKKDSGKETVIIGTAAGAVTAGLPVAKEVAGFFKSYELKTIVMAGMAFGAVLILIGLWRIWRGAIIAYEGRQNGTQPKV